MVPDNAMSDGAQGQQPNPDVTPMNAIPLAGYHPDMDAMRRDVEALASMSRSSARSGERESASWLRRRLADVGVPDVQLEAYRYQPSYALAHGVHNVVGIGACRLGGLTGGLLAAATLWSYEREVSGSSQWVRRLLPGGEGANVVARVRARSERSAAVVLVAHHDAANTGVVWNPRLVAAGGARHMRRRQVDPFMAPLGGALCCSPQPGLCSGDAARSVAGPARSPRGSSRWPARSPPTWAAARQFPGRAITRAESQHASIWRGLCVLSPSSTPKWCSCFQGARRPGWAVWPHSSTVMAPGWA